MRIPFLAIGLFFASCAQSPTVPLTDPAVDNWKAPPIVWEKNVASGRYGGDVYSLQKEDGTSCMVEFADEYDGVFLKAKSPIVLGVMQITVRVIFPRYREWNAAELYYETRPNGTYNFTGFAFVDPTDENDVFLHECAVPVRSGVIMGPEGRFIPIPPYVKNGFHGVYGFGEDT